MGTRNGANRALVATLGGALVAACSLTLAPVVAAATTTAAAVPAGASVSATGGNAGVQLPAIPAGMELIADDGTLRLAANMGTGDFAVIDERNGAIWYSSVPTPQAYATNTYWRDTLESQFGMGRTTTERSNEIAQNNQFNQSQDLATLQVSRIANGMAMDYTFSGDAISFEVDVVLSADHLVVTVPGKSVMESLNTKTKQPLPLSVAGTTAGAKEGACPRFTPPPPTMSLQLFYFPPECYELSSINFLPAFGAGAPGQDGYIVVPDGSGAQIDFQKVHPTYTNEYNAPVYGDPTTTPFGDEWLPEANMPVFGIVHSDPKSQAQSSAMLGVITEGAADANIVVVPAGQRANLYMASVNFVYRPLYDALGVGMVSNQEYSWKPILGDRQVTYYFLNGQAANYSGLALRYRQYLIDSQHATPLTPKAEPPLLLHVLNGIRETGVQFDPFEKATTFSETQQMLQDLKAAGVGDIRATLEGWMDNGYEAQTLPKIWPPAGQLGGVGGLRSLATYSKSNGVQLVLATNVYHAWQSSGSFNARTDSLHQESQIIFQDFGKALLVSPDFAEHQLYPPLQKQFAKLGIAGTDFDYLARDVYPNYATNHVLTRAQSAQDWMNMVSAARVDLGSAGVQGGNTYAVGAANYFYNAPTTDSGFNYETGSIPFWEIAVHGLALYSGRESNLLSSPTLDKLQMIEDGALPAWELTWQPASDLRYTYYDTLYSSQFSQWGTAAEQEYQQEAQRGYARLAYVAMTGNETVAPGVAVSDYADGSHVVVNFNSNPVTLSAQYGGRVVPAQDYIVISGGGQ